jgi:Ni/Co efflux regulator RcnB
MKATRIACLALASTLAFGSVAMAQPGRDGNQQQRGQDARGDHRQGNDRRDNDRRDNRGAERSNERGYQNYGARGPEWRRGGYVPREYRSRQYVVNDWRSHRLSAPPRGYQWVQVGGDYVLAAIATGLIAQLLLNN